MGARKCWRLPRHLYLASKWSIGAWHWEAGAERVGASHGSLKMLQLHDPGLAPTMLKSTYMLSATADHYLKPHCSLWGKLILELWKRQILFRKGFGEFRSWLLFILEWNVTFSNSWQRKILEKAAFQIDQNGSFWVGLAWFHNLPEEGKIKKHYMHRSRFKMKTQKGQKKISLPKLKTNWHDS